jgi:lipopolysaccharide export system protein LptA
MKNIRKMTCLNLLICVCLFGQSRTFLIKSDKYKVVFKKGREMERYYGNAKITVITADNKRDTEIRANVAEVYADERRKAYCRREIYIIDKKNNVVMTGDEAEYYDRYKYARVTKTPFLYIKEDQVTIEAEEMERFVEKKISLAKGNVVVKTRSVEAHSIFMTYHEDEHKIIMTGNPWIVRKGDRFAAEKIILYTNKDTLLLLGQITAKFKQKR